MVRSADDALSRVDDRESLLSALRSLTPRQRAAIVLTELLDMSSEEAAEALAVKPATVRVLVGRARAAMRKELEQADE